MIHFIGTHMRPPTFVGIKSENDLMFSLSDEHNPGDMKMINSMEWIHSITNQETPMDRMIHCDREIEAILEILDRPSLNSFQQEEEILNLINELKEEPRKRELL
jgi:hypothetical protein